MTTRDDGGPAFPRDAVLGQSGMSLRDWYAVQSFPIAYHMANPEGLLLPSEITAAEISKLAFQLADAMLAERSKP